MRSAWDADWEKIAKLRTELEITAPAAGASGEWSAASELAEVEKLAEMGVVVRPRAEVATTRSKGKGKAREIPNEGHVVFVDDKGECECSSYVGLTFAVESYAGESEEVEMPEAEEEEVDLGWLEPEMKKKKKQAKSDVAPTAASDEPEDTINEARVSRPPVRSDPRRNTDLSS